LPRISRASGGLMRGVDLTDLSALQQSDDLDDLAPMKHLN
jgi:hypothetical protein